MGEHAKTTMKCLKAVLTTACLVFSIAPAAITHAWAAEPFAMQKALPVPGEGGGEFDHFTIDLTGNRLFVADEGHAAVYVYDTNTNELVTILGKGVIHSPHSMTYRADLGQLYVVDGDFKFGAVRIYDTKSYKLLKTIELPPMSDWSAYDPVTKQLWVSEIGIVQKKAESTVQVIDTSAGTILSEFTVDDNVITDLSIDPTKPVLYTALRTKSFIAVIDRMSHKTIATWPVTGCTGLGHMAEDPDNHLLFDNCRSGQMLVFDTETGKQIASVPINQHSDELQYIKATKRLYIVAQGAPKEGTPTIEVIQQIDRDHYQSLGQAVTSEGARTGIFVPEYQKYYVGAPKTSTKAPQVLVYGAN